MDNPPLPFHFPDHQDLASKLREKSALREGNWTLRSFPDGESYVQVLSPVKNIKTTILVSLNTPNTKVLPLYFLSKTLKELGAKSVNLICPYLAYMRQDIAFQEGEAVTSIHFANLLSSCLDDLTTVDPHLHRHNHLSDIYSIPTLNVHAGPAMADWIKQHVSNPIIIGPDSESDQWVSKVGKLANAPHIILEKIRHGDRDVEIRFPDLENHQGRTPVLVDDIISTGHTMAKVVSALAAQDFVAPVCIGTHAVFAQDAAKTLKQAGASQVVTTNTIPHPSNKIDISDLLLSTTS